jgi:ribonuclease Z
LSWVILGPKAKGKFDLGKATELGVPSGPLRARLVNGESVTFEIPDPNSPGEKMTVEVKPEQVVMPSEAPAVGDSS